jgi:hypothetical protein
MGPLDLTQARVVPVSPRRIVASLEPAGISDDASWLRRVEQSLAYDQPRVVTAPGQPPYQPALAVLSMRAAASPVRTPCDPSLRSQPWTAFPPAGRPVPFSPYLGRRGDGWIPASMADPLCSWVTEHRLVFRIILISFYERHVGSLLLSEDC